MSSFRPPGPSAFALLALVSAAGCACPHRGDPCAEPCGSTGACTVSERWAGDKGLRCYPTSTPGCAASVGCREEGACHFEAEVAIDRCVALSPSDCLSSTGCRAQGRCTLSDDGRCVATEVGCKLSEACTRDGACQPRKASDPRFPPPRLGCVRSGVDEALWCEAACREEGGCQREGQRCLPGSDEDCQRSEGCRAHGRCARAAEHRVCVAATEAQCASSSGCTGGGAGAACRLAPGGRFCLDDRAPCARQPTCLALGWCSAVEGVCRAQLEPDCRASLACQLAGACQLDTSQATCFPGGDAACASSDECAFFGRCRQVSTLGAAACVASDGRRDAYPLRCLAAPACEHEARCLRTPDNRCVTRDEVQPPPGPRGVTGAPTGRALPTELSPASMSASLDGRQVVLTHAVAMTSGGRALRVQLGDHPLDCADLVEPRRQKKEGTTLELHLAPVFLETQGAPRRRWRRPASDTWRVTRASWPGGAGADLEARVTVDEALQRGRDGRVGLTTTLHFLVSNQLSTLTLDGAMNVQGCGDQPPPGRALERPPRVVLDGEPVIIRGATFRSEVDDPGTWQLTLSDSPARCRGGASDLEIVVRALSRTGKRTRWVSLGAKGRRLGTEVAMQRPAPPDLPVPVRREDGTVWLDLDFKTQDGDALPLAITGSVAAVDCDPRLNEP